MDDFSEWDHFVECLDSSRSYEQAWLRYRKERRERIKNENARELRQLDRDNARDAKRA